MANEEQRCAVASATPPKVVGLGAPISVWIYFEIAEIPALTDTINGELGRHGGSEQIEARAVGPEAGVDQLDGCGGVGELRRMLGDVEQATEKYLGRFDVVWPTVMAHRVLHGAVGHAERRAAAAAASHATAARQALAAAQKTLRDFEAVDGGGLLDVWL